MFETIGLGFLIFIVTFWIVIFMILPLRYESQDEIVKGTTESAPKHPHFKFKFFLTFCLSLFLTILILIYAGQGLESLAHTEWKF